MGHARLAPSAAHRWMRCPGSTVLEQGMPRTSSVHSATGTAAHSAASAILEGFKPSVFVNEASLVDGFAIVLTAEHVAHIMKYVDAIRLRIAARPAVELEIEQKLDISEAAGEECSGTGDAIVLAPLEQTIYIDDLKFGMGVPVSAEENEQMLCYAVGALAKYGIVADFKRVVLSIHQPRIDNSNSWETTVEHVMKFAERLSFAAAATRNARDVADVVGVDSKDFRAFLHPSEKACHWCPAKAACPAIERQLTELFASADAPQAMTLLDAVAIAPNPQNMTDAKLTLVVEHAEMVEGWLKSVRAEAQRRMMNGQPVVGLKLVEGKKGDRSLKDAAAASTILADVALAWEPRKLKSVAQLEKTAKLTKEQWEAITPLITRAPGKPHVALESDKRAVYTPALDSDFADMSDGQDIL